MIMMTFAHAHTKLRTPRAGSPHPHADALAFAIEQDTRKTVDSMIAAANLASSHWPSRPMLLLGLVVSVCCGATSASDPTLAPTISNLWPMPGSVVHGEAATQDCFGLSTSLSANGARLAVSAHGNDGTGPNAGHVRVFSWSNGTWVQLGGDIDREAANDWFGRAVSLSVDGTRLAVGARLNDGTGTNAGHVRVFEWSNGAWVQLGDDVDGRAAGDPFGFSVSLSADGARLAVGATGDDCTGTDAGHVRVFELSNGAWVQLGGDIDGEAAGDQSGCSVSLSADGARLAIGALCNDGAGTTTGQVRVFLLSNGA